MSWAAAPLAKATREAERAAAENFMVVDGEGGRRAWQGRKRGLGVEAGEREERGQRARIHSDTASFPRTAGRLPGGASASCSGRACYAVRDVCSVPLP